MILCREWLAKDERRRIVFHWCPSHDSEGVRWSELVDGSEDAKRAADIPLERDECSLAHAHHLLTVQFKAGWGEKYRSSRAYAGHNFLQLKAFVPPNHLSSPALQAHGHSKTTMVRFCRAFLNQARLGLFRQRLFWHEPTDFPECGMLQDRRARILSKQCMRYRRRWWGLRGEFKFLLRVNADRELNISLTTNESAFPMEDAPT